MSQQVEAAKAALTHDVTEKARTAVEVELADLKRRADEKEKLLKAAQAAELELRQQKRLLEDREKALELEVARKLDAERRTIEEATTKRLDEEHRLREAEKDKRLQDALKVNEDLRRKLQQGSQQAQGEVLELELETLLANTFPFNSVSPVPKGVTGADVVQKVVSPSGHDCGTIVWEAKRTKNWSDGWVQKVKDRPAHAQSGTRGDRHRGTAEGLPQLQPRQRGVDCKPAMRAEPRHGPPDAVDPGRDGEAGSGRQE